MNSLLRPRTLSRIVVGAVIVICLVVIGYFATAPRGDQAAPPPALVGTPLNGTPVPAFHLRDQNGQVVDPRAMTARATIVTFFYTHCVDTCPLTAQKIRHVIEGLRAQGRKVSVIAVSTDPVRDTPALARRFLALHGLPQWHFVLGSYAQLKVVWARFHVFAASPSQQARLGAMHTAGMYLVDRQGRERVYLDDSTPGTQIAADLRILLGDRGVSTAAPVAPHAGDVAPNFNLATLAGPNLSLRSLRGRPVLVNFWATWCVPCKKEMPLLQRTYRQYHGRLAIVGVDQQETAAAVRGFIHAYHITYPIALDQAGDVAYAYEISGTPVSFLLDRTGIIRFETVGALSPTGLRRELRQVLPG